MLRIILRDSIGGVGAKITSRPAVRTSLAINRLLILDAWSSPLLTSTHLTEIGERPVFALAFFDAPHVPDIFALEIIDLVHPCGPTKAIIER